MKARIDIQTPAGKSLEGYPITIDDIPDNTDDLFGPDDLHKLYFNTQCVNYHPGDKITIEILP